MGIIRQCNHCGEYFGTPKAYQMHIGKTKCRSARSMKEDGLYKNYNVWFFGGYTETEDWGDGPPYPIDL